MSSTPEILTLSDDPQLQSELQSAGEVLGDRQPRLRFANDRRDLWEAIRTRPPALILLPFGETPGEVCQLARELAGAAVGSDIPVAAIFRPHGFGDDVSESAILIEAMRAGVQDFLRRPISTTEFSTLLETVLRQPGQAAGAASPTFGRVVAFISNKGGVGKSTLAANVAVGLARRHPNRVMLIDASLQMGVAATLLNLQPTSTLSDAALERDRLDETMLRQMAAAHPCGLHLMAAPLDAVAALDVDDTLMAQVITLARRQYDFVVVDTFPMFDRVVVAILDLADRAYLVVENVVPTLLGAVALIDVLERIGFPADRQRVVVNRHQRVAGSLALEDVAARLRRPIEHVLPYDKRVIAAANVGDPVALQSIGWGGFSRSLQRLVADVDQLKPQGTPSVDLGNGRALPALEGSATNANHDEETR